MVSRVIKICSRTLLIAGCFSLFPKALLVTAIGAILAAGTPFAAAEDGASARTLEEIIITARKREESLQDVPVQVSAISGKDLELRGIKA